MVSQSTCGIAHHSRVGDEQRQVLNAVHTALLHNRMLKISSQVLQQEGAH